MKIAIINIYSGLVNRGAETVSDALAQEWTKSGNEVLVIAGGQIPNRSYEQKVVDGIVPVETEVQVNLIMKNLYMFGRLSTYEKMLVKFTKKAINFLNDYQPEVILSLNGSRQLEFLVKAGWGLKTIAIIHGQNETRRWKLGGQENRKILKQSVGGFVVVNPTMSDWAVSKVGAHIVRLIPNGVDLDFFRPGKTKTTKKQIICVAGLQKFKRVDLLIKAVAKMDNVELLVVGKGPEKQNLEQLIKELKIDERVKIIESNHDQMPRLYYEAQVFSLPSMSIEAFGVAYLEAMACGLSVVGPNDKLREMIVGDPGFLTDVTNAKNYAQSLEMALNENWDEKPRAQASKFGWEEISKQYLEFFEEVRIKED